jgi:hypothetical protein
LFGDRRVFVDREREIIVKIKSKIYEELNNVEKELKTGKYSLEERADFKEYKLELGEGLRAKSYDEFSGFSYGDSLFHEDLEELKEVEDKKKRNANKNYFSFDFARPDLAILWRKQIYFVREWQYINNYKLYVKIWARKDLLAMYY